VLLRFYKHKMSVHTQWCIRAAAG